MFGGYDTEGLAAGLEPGAIHLSMSTISTAAAAECASEHARRGQGYVAAPVFGNPDAARARQLFVVAAGAAIDVERCRLLTDNLGQTFVVGEDPAQANLIKLLGNIMTATTLEVLGETVAVLRKRGFDPKRFIDILTSTMFAGRVHRIYGNKIVEESYAPGFVMPLALKDVRLALAEAEKQGSPCIGNGGARSPDRGNRPRPRGPRLDGARPCRRGGIGSRRPSNVNGEAGGRMAERVRLPIPGFVVGSVGSTTFSLKFIDVMSLLLTSLLARALRRSAKPNHGSRCRNCRA